MIGVADACGEDLYQDFERLRMRYLDFLDGESSRPVCDGCQRFHGCNAIKVEMSRLKSAITEKSLAWVEVILRDCAIDRPSPNSGACN